jgi:hypothetical protein
LLPACGGAGGVTELRVELTEWQVRPATVDSLDAGRLKVLVTNAGKRSHELIIVKSDAPPEQLEVADGRVDVSKLEVKGAIEPVGAGSSTEFSVSLSPGKYVLICNLIERPPGQPVEGHYAFGMSAGLLLD